MRGRALAPIIALTLGSLSGRAAAFCRATACDPSDEKAACTFDARGCPTSGQALAWRSDCVSVWVQRDGSPRSGIDYAAAEAAVERAFGAWSAADCGDGEAPSLEVQVRGPISCDASEFGESSHNANLVVFRDETWPYVGAEDALGLTRVRFRASTGEILDADIEINATSLPLSIGLPVQGADLDSLLTHEVGHFLGLAHSRVESSTMVAGYEEGDSSLASLAPDDESGICTVYPPGRATKTASCAPYGGFADACVADQPADADADADADEPEQSGCSLVGPTCPGHGGLAFIGLALLVMLKRRSRFKGRRS